MVIAFYGLLSGVFTGVTLFLIGRGVIKMYAKQLADMGATARLAIDKYKEDVEVELAKNYIEQELLNQSKSLESMQKLKNEIKQAQEDNMKLFDHIRAENSSDLTNRVVIAAYQVVRRWGKTPRGIEDGELTKAIMMHQDAGLSKLQESNKLVTVPRDGGLN